MSDSERAQSGNSEGMPDFDAMTDEEIAEWKREQKAELDSALEAETGLSDSEADALDALIDAREDEQNTATVELAEGVEVEVKTHTNATVEDKLDFIANNQSDLQAVRSELIECIAWFIEDPDYGEAAVWSAYAEQYGLVYLADVFERVVEPSLGDMPASEEAIRKFRGE